MDRKEKSRKLNVRNIVILSRTLFYIYKWIHVGIFSTLYSDPFHSVPFSPFPPIFFCPRLHSTLSGHSFIFFLQQQQDRPQKYGTLKNLFHFIITKSEINISEKEMDLWLQIFTENNISFFIFWWMDIVLNVFVISPSSSFSFSSLSSLSHHHHHHSHRRSFYCGIEWGCLGVVFLYFHFNAWDWML